MEAVLFLFIKFIESHLLAFCNYFNIRAYHAHGFAAIFV